METTHAPSAGALRAAHKVLRHAHENITSNVDKCATMIDQETHAGDMAEALENAIRTMRVYGTENMGYAIDEAQSALDAYRGTK